MSAISVQHATRARLSTIAAIRNDKSFNIFCERIIKKVKSQNMAKKSKKEKSQQSKIFSSKVCWWLSKAEVHHPETSKF